MAEQIPREHILFQEENVQITDKRAMLGPKTYSIANITSVAGVKVKSNLALPIVLLFLGGISLIFYVLLLIDGQSVTGLLTLGLALGVPGALLLRSRGTAKYIVRIGSASGEVDGMVSKNQELIMRVVKAINDAIVMRS